VAVEQCAEDDLLAVVPTPPCDTGYFGELLATSLAASVASTRGTELLSVVGL